MALVILAVAAPAASALVVHLPNGRFAGVYLRPGLSAAAYERHTGARPLTHAVPATTPDPNGLFYFDGPVLHATSPYLVFWDPSANISAASRQIMTRYYTDASQDSNNPSDVYAYRVLAQYSDSGGYAGQGQTFSAARQVIDDGQAYPTTADSACTSTNRSGFAACISDTQIQAEVTRLITTDGLPSGIGPNAPIYFVVTPANVNVCMDQADCSGGTNGVFCAYHDDYDLPGTSSPVIYASIPFTAGAGCQSAGPVNPPTQEPNGDVADVVTDNMSHENAEAITDPLGNAWLTSRGYEVADQCEAYGSNNPNDESGSPDGPTSLDAYAPTLGGSQSGGTLYDQQINSDHYFTQTLWSNSDDNCAATPTAGSITPSFTSPASVLPGASASFDPTASTSTNGYSSATWSWADGSADTFLTGPPTAVSHTFTTPGNYTVTLTLVDADGNTARVSHTVVVDSPPSAAFSASATVAETGSPAAFNGAGSSDPNPGQSITAYSWSFGDGSPAGAGTAPSHVYSSPGTYTITLTVTGTDGLTATVSHAITVVAAPVAIPSLSTQKPVTGSPVSFNGGASTGGISVYAWNFGDGATGSGASPTHTYTRVGTYTVTLTVTDASGFTSTRSLTVAIARSPIAVVSTKRVHGTYYLVVTVTQVGTVKVGSTKITLKRPGKATFKIALSTAQKHRLAQGKSVSLNETIIFTPKHGAQIRNPTTVKLKG